MLGVTTQIIEGQHGNRRPTRKTGHGSSRMLFPILSDPDSVHPDRLRNVLDFMVAEILELETEFLVDLVEGGSRDRHAAGFSEGLDPSCNVHPVAVDPIFLDDHVPEVDPDPEKHPARLRAFCVCAGQLVLDECAAGDGIHDTGEVGQEVVPDGIDHSASVLSDQPTHEIAGCL